ncbi:hypothetical protein ANO11243_097550 [Dothideomycetidae sp. 11243]|nr:hypothetical protein ANO11243_097550 [fungal sp. No.11243]
MVAYPQVDGSIRLDTIDNTTTYLSSSSVAISGNASVLDLFITSNRGSILRYTRTTAAGTWQGPQTIISDASINGPGAPLAAIQIPGTGDTAVFLNNDHGDIIAFSGPPAASSSLSSAVIWTEPRQPLAINTQSYVTAVTNTSHPGQVTVFGVQRSNNLIAMTWNAATGNVTATTIFPPGNGSVDNFGILYTTVSRGATYAFVIGSPSEGIVVGSIDGAGNARAPVQISAPGDMYTDEILPGFAPNAPDELPYLFAIDDAGKLSKHWLDETDTWQRVVVLDKV